MSEEFRKVRCSGCDKLLGEFDGRGRVKCTRTGCGGMNVFDTTTGKHYFIPKTKPPGR